MKRFITILSLSVILFCICGAPTISFQILRPAIITIPEYINSVGLIDRTLLMDKTKNILEGGLTGELPGGDKIASQFALEGLMNVMQNSGRYKVLRTAKNYVKNSIPENFPEPLEWIEIEKLCSNFKVNAIIALEVFDSDYIITNNMIRVTVGFRLYDPKERIVFDQNFFTHEMVWGGQVNSVAGAVNKLLEKDRAIKDASYEAGMIYGERISPSWYTVRREYYRKPKSDQNLCEGARMMEVNNWDAAKDALLKAMNSKKRKTKGRAAHNMAVVYEILGDYQEAQSWAQDAWGKYENKGSKNYSYILGQRIRENQILNEQK